MRAAGRAGERRRASAPAAVLLLLAASLASLFGGCSGRSITIPTNQKPTVTATGTPLSGNPPLAVAFTTTASDPDGRIVEVFWNFQDGATSTELNPVHVFSTIGFFHASVTVRDEWGAADSFQVSVNVSPNTLPTASAGPDQTNRNPGSFIQLNGTASSDPDAGQTLTYAWTRTAGVAVTLTGASTATPSFTANSLADTAYTFQLRVTDDGTPQLFDDDFVTVTTRWTYNNRIASVLNTRCDAPGLGATCHGTSGSRVRLNSFATATANTSLLDSKIYGTMRGYLGVEGPWSIHKWISHGAPLTN